MGRIALAGAINLIAAKPTQTFEAGAAATYGSYNDYTIEGFASGPISDALGVRVAARHDGGEWLPQKSITQPGLTMGATDLTGRSRHRRLAARREPLKSNSTSTASWIARSRRAPQMFYVLPASAAIIPALA